MEKELKSVVWDKYMESDIDSVTLVFDEHTENSLVGEFEVPEEEMHVVFYSEKKDNGSWDWVEIVNPAGVINSENATLPDISVKIDGNVYDLQKALEIIINAA